MRITIHIPNLQEIKEKRKWKRGVRLTTEQAQRISAQLLWLRNSDAGEHYTFGQKDIKAMEDVIDAQLYDGRVYYRGTLGLWVDDEFIPQTMRSGKWVNK